MDIKKVRLLCFSPTRTSRKVGEAVTRGMEVTEVEICDVTHEALSLPIETPDNTFTIMAVPVYAGHVPALALERMDGIRAQGNAPCAVIVVYGNRDYEGALEELAAFASGHGFKVVAAGTFVGEHSYSTEVHPIATGRPDENDLRDAENFGKGIREKMTAAPDAGSLSPVEVKAIERPSQPLDRLQAFMGEAVKMRKNGTPPPVVPETDEDLCTHCGRCVKVCPNAAIVKGDECHTLAERCIRCCACVKSCPHKTRSFNIPFAGLLSEYFSEPKANKWML